MLRETLYKNVQIVANMYFKMGEFILKVAQKIYLQSKG